MSGGQEFAPVISHARRSTTQYALMTSRIAGTCFIVIQFSSRFFMLLFTNTHFRNTGSDTAETYLIILS